MARLHHQYQQGTADWRASLAKNTQRTRVVIFLFFAIYVLLGLVVDLYVHVAIEGRPLSLILDELLRGEFVPFATLLLGGIATIALWVTYAFYDRIMLLGMSYKEITPDAALTQQEKQLYHIVEEMKVAAGLSYMPKVYLIQADYMNAFASGYSERSAMVAITYGLLMKLDRAETQAVMAHELSHIRHMDIKLTLTVGVLTNIMLIVIDGLFHAFLFNRNRQNRRDSHALFAVILVLRYLLPLVTVLLTLYLSRTREYMADAGAVELTRHNEPLARALIKIHEDHDRYQQEYQAEYNNTPHEEVRRAAYLYDPVKGGVESALSVASLFSTHPTLAERLAALGFRKKS